MAGLLAQRGQTLERRLPEDLPVISGDAPRLTQVVTNLLANASKFGPEDSEITIGATRRATRSSSRSRMPGPARRSSRALRSSSASTARPTRSRTRAAWGSASGS